MTFTPKQKELIKLAKEKGFITHETLNAVFSSPIARKANLEKFIAMKILKETDMVGKYKLDTDVLKGLE